MGSGQGNEVELKQQEQGDQKDSTGASTKPPESKGLQLVQHMFSAGHHEPDSVANVLVDHPHDGQDIIGFLHGTVGNGFVQQVLAVVDDQKSAAPIVASFPTNSADTDTTKPKRPEPKKAKAYNEYAVKPEAKRETPLTLDTYHALDGSDVSTIATKGSEAPFLNEIRHAMPRFDPAALKKAQEQLHVTNASGAFNTETLRALLAKTGGTLDKKENAKHPEKKLLTVADVMTPAFWTPWYADPDPPMFMANAEVPADVDADSTATTFADKAAQGMGAKSYQDYYDRVLQPIPTFLGKPVHGGKAHPDLIARLRAAERFLTNYYKGKKDRNNKPIDEAMIAKEIGWSGELVTIYDPNPDTMVGGELVQKADPAKGIKEVRKNGVFKPTHFHNMGLAVDFDPAHNPYIFDQSDPLNNRTGQVAGQNAKERADSKKAHEKDPTVSEVKASDQMDPHAAGVEARDYYDNMARAAYKQAADLYGGEPMSQATMMQWSATLSSEELHAKVMQASKSMSQYLTDGEAAAREGAAGPANDKILRLFADAGYSPEKAKAGLAEMKSFPKDFWHIMSRDGTRDGTGHNTATNTQGLELTVALRDAGGLMWGGTEMSHGDNGDFMHFDLRQDAVGQRFINALSGAKK